MADDQVRAISVVKEAHEQGVLPTVISLQTLALHNPTLAEWKKILNLRHLVRCFEHTFLLPKNGQTCFYRSPHFWQAEFTPPSDPLYLQLWSENFHIATYRALIMGAVLSRSYQHPFFSPEKPEGFLDHFTKDFNEGNGSEDLTLKDSRYLCKFPVYDLEAYDNMGPAFGTLTDWLLEDCKSQIIARDNADLEESNNSQGPLFREIARIMVIYSHFCNGVNGAYFQYPDFAHLDPDFEFVELSGPTRTVHIVPMGDFQIHEVKMPASIEAVDTMLPYIRQLPSIQGPKIPMLSVVLQGLYTKSGRPNCRNPGPFGGHPSPEPPLQIFEFILRKQFGFVFESSAFEIGYTEQPWKRFCEDGDIFGNVSKTACPIESAYPPPVSTYHRI